MPTVPHAAMLLLRDENRGGGRKEAYDPTERSEHPSASRGTLAWLVGLPVPQAFEHNKLTAAVTKACRRTQEFELARGVCSGLLRGELKGLGKDSPSRATTNTDGDEEAP